MPQILVRRPSPRLASPRLADGELSESGKLEGCVTCLSVRIRTARAATVPA
jgi:hypothetical protein